VLQELEDGGAICTLGKMPASLNGAFQRFAALLNRSRAFKAQILVNGNCIIVRLVHAPRL
jgi:hypothetical protein